MFETSNFAPMDFLTLSKNLKKDNTAFPVYKIAWVSDVATQLVAKALRGYAFDLKLNLEVYEAGLGLAEAEILNIESNFHQFKPQSIFFYHSLAKLQSEFYKIDKKKRETFAEDFLGRIKSQISFLTEYNNVFIGTVPELADPVHGFSENNFTFSFSRQVEQINRGISELCINHTNCKPFSVHTLVSEIGYYHFFDPQLYYSSLSDISFKVLPEFARFTLQHISSQTGNIKKCIVLDLDNTLWGGIAGDDGWENLEIGNLGKGKVFTDIQYWLKELKSNGILLVVCSKNEESIAKEVFDKNPEMVLKLDDFVLFVANWNDKAENIRIILETLNIGTDSIVFLDDNASEREQVRQVFPDLTIPELPNDVSEWLSFLIRQNYFQTGNQTAEDQDRTAKYQQQAARVKEASKVVDHDSYLQSLQMEAKVELLNPFNLPRVAQLTQRTNQFNLRTIRYTESEIQNRIISGNYIGYAVSLKDKFGDEGIVSFVLLEKRPDCLFIDTWVMSCRVFGRGLEFLVFNVILEEAGKFDLPISLEYIPTAKNKYVENLLPELGFPKDELHSQLIPKSPPLYKHFIIILN